MGGGRGVQPGPREQAAAWGPGGAVAGSLRVQRGDRRGHFPTGLRSGGLRRPPPGLGLRAPGRGEPQGGGPRDAAPGGAQGAPQNPSPAPASGSARCGGAAGAGMPQGGAPRAGMLGMLGSPSTK